jgi:hypothetical protein
MNNLMCIICLKEANIIIEGMTLCVDCYKKTVYWLGYPTEKRQNAGKQIWQLRKEAKHEEKK